MTPLDAMKQALEALIDFNQQSIGGIALPAEIDTAMDALRSALEAAEKVEPSKYSDIISDGGFDPRDRHHAPAVPEVDCAVCTNRGGVHGLSQESNCEHCLWQGHWHKKNLFAAPTQEET